MVIILVGGVLLLSSTCPDKKAHEEAITEVLSEVYDDMIDENLDEKDASNKIVQGITKLGNMFMDKIVGTVLDSELKVDNYLICSVGSIRYDGKTRFVSFGILNNVYTFDKDDIKRYLKK